MNVGTEEMDEPTYQAKLTGVLDVAAVQVFELPTRLRRLLEIAEVVVGVALARGQRDVPIAIARNVRIGLGPTCLLCLRHGVGAGIDGEGVMVVGAWRG